MSLTLHLGVIDLPYADPGPKQRVAKAHKGRQQPRRRRQQGGQTTGDVAEILEAKYHVMEQFFEVNEEAIGELFAEALTGALETVIMGGPPPADPFAGATAELEAMFKQFLETEGLAETGTPGVPTLAALRGVSHRLKHPYAKGNPRRPSFIDTGMYEESFKTWLD